MQGFIPDLVIRQTKSSNAWSRIAGLIDQLLKSEKRDEGSGAVHVAGGLIAYSVLAQRAARTIREGQCDGLDGLRC